MMARANPRFALRPMLPADAVVLAEIFRASVEELTADEYNPAQQEAWMSAADNEEAFAKRLGRHLALVVTLDGSPIGFATLEGPTKIDMVYVHPAAAGHGAGAMLVDALEKLAGSRGAAHLMVDASDSAREFFAHRGFTAEQRNSVLVGGEWLSNTTMKKKLAGAKETAQ